MPWASSPTSLPLGWDSAPSSPRPQPRALLPSDPLTTLSPWTTANTGCTRSNVQTQPSEKQMHLGGGSLRLPPAFLLDILLFSGGQWCAEPAPGLFPPHPWSGGGNYRTLTLPSLLAAAESHYRVPRCPPP